MAMHEALQNLWYQLALLAKKKGLLMSPLKPDTIAELRTVTMEEQFLREGNAQESREVMQEGERELQIASMLCLCLQSAQTLRMPSSREQAETI
jgi:hypothetical protein